MGRRLVLSFFISTSTYLSADQYWLSDFFRLTKLSTFELTRLVEGLPSVLKSQESCTFESAPKVVKTFANLNVEYLHRMLEGRGDLLMSIWSLRSFHAKNYLKFMGGIVKALEESYLTWKVIAPLDQKVAKNLVLHTVNQLQFPLEACKGIFENPKARDINKAFEAVKNTVSSKSSVDRTSKQLVLQAVSYDVESLKYMDKIAGLGALSVLSDRLFRLYKETLAIVKALPEE